MEEVVAQLAGLIILQLVVSAFLVFIIYPMMSYRKFEKKGMSKKAIISDVKTEVTDPVVKKVEGSIKLFETTVNERINDMNVHVADIKEQIDNIEFPVIPEFPQDIPSMEKITKLVEDGRENTIDYMGKIEVQIAKNMETIDKNIPVHITNGLLEMKAEFKSEQGKIYADRGVDKHHYEKGMEAAKTVMLAEVENPTGEPTPMIQIARHFVNTAVKGGLIDAEDADAKMGLIHGVIEGIGMLQNRGKASGNGGGFPTPLSPSIPSHGKNQLLSYYR